MWVRARKSYKFYFQTGHVESQVRLSGGLLFFLLAWVCEDSPVIDGKWFSLAARAPPKPNNECGNWQLAAKKATRTRTRTRKSAKRQRQRRQQLWSALVGRQEKQQKIKGQEIKAYMHTFVWNFFSLWQVRPSRSGRSRIAILPAAAVNMLLLVCFCGFVAHHRQAQNSPQSFAHVSVSCGYLYLYLHLHLYVCGLARVSPKGFRLSCCCCCILWACRLTDISFWCAYVPDLAYALVGAEGATCRQGLLRRGLRGAYHQRSNVTF